MRHLIITLATIIAASMFSGAWAKEGDYTDPYEGYDEFVFMEYTLDENIATPAVPKKEKKAVQSYISKVKDRLKGLRTGREKTTYTFDLIRDNEVIIVTIPTDDLFLPNDTVLSARGKANLERLVPFFFTDPDMYKVLFAVNTDDSGSVSYLENLSEQRTNEIYGWMIDNRNIADNLIFIPYSNGPEEPLYPNDSMARRAGNRRLEIFIIPGPKMIQMAHEGKLK